MIRRASLPLSIAAVFLLLLPVAGYVEARRGNLSPTTRATLDGQTFEADESAPGDFSKLRREVGRMGVVLPHDFEFREDLLPYRHPAFSGKLSGTSRSSARKKQDVPHGLREEHSLFLEGEGDTVELVYGAIEFRGVVRSRLEAEGWECFIAGEGTGGTTVLRRTRGKEVSIVWLDETEGEFLLVREVDL